MATGDGREDVPRALASLRLPHLGFWLGGGPPIPVDAGRAGAGLHSIDVAVPGPAYVTLHLDFADASLAPLVVPLERAGPGRYRRTFSLLAPPRMAWLDVTPHPAPGDAATVRFDRARTGDLAAIGVRAALRHARSPRTFIAMARQVLAGSASFVFAGGADTPPGDAAGYANWQLAFESDRQAERLAAALAERIGSRCVRVLAVVADWAHGEPALDEVLRSLANAPSTELHVLSAAPGAGSSARPAKATARSWEQHDARDLPVRAIADAVSRSSADFVVVLDRPGIFNPLAVTCLALALALEPGAVAVYADHDTVDDNGRRTDPVFKPAWSPDYEAAADYVAQPVGFRGDPRLFSGLERATAPRWTASALLAALSEDKRSRVPHIPRVLFHARGRTTGGPGRIVAAPKPTPSLASPRVTVILPSRDNADLLERACNSVEASGYRSVETIVIDNGSVTTAQSSLLSQLAGKRGVRVLRDPAPFNFSRLINLGRAHATGDVLVLLNDDVEAIEPGWLAELAGQAARPEIGCVGALLLFPDMRIQHAGVLVGINGGAGHAFRHAASNLAPEHGGLRLAVAREVSAVTGACLAVRAAVFDEVGGFAEDLPVTLNDIDFCLKVRERGYRNLFTPRARLIHRESTSRGYDATPERLRRLSRETAIFRQRWGEVALVDPYFSPHLSPAHEDFRIRSL